MDGYLLDWVNLLLRWAHVITAIAWIGSSFYFVFLDNSLTKPTAPDLTAKGVDGELWAVHGGGFYHPQKYLVAPKQMPDHLHWFYWESYSTWLTGFALFTVLYLFNAGTFLIDKSVYDWSPAAAIAAALGFLVVFWLVYDVICRAFGRQKNGDLIVGAGVFVFVVAASWLACQLFAGRAAFLLVGAMLATAMSANVFFWIIPGQRKVVAQLKAGQPVDPIYGWRAKQRSVHNTYFTLPVLVAMLSNHYGWLYQAQHNWLVLVLLMLAGALIRHSFVARHKALVQGKRVPWEHAVVGTAALVGLAIWLAPRPAEAQAQAKPQAAQAKAAAPAAAKTVAFSEVKAVIDQRCVMCHSAAMKSKGIALDKPELVKQHAQQVYQQTAVLKLMPMNNATRITDDERALIKRWHEAGAPVK
ncbi:urate hydroxylase PuuD [Roseateles asaccharophilus]|uniref:Membrane protein n=1 Tax=Roseateles asaccharophilus TaxID=582607 RepID=A0ABU2AC72_9BURK|nr:urate hydroxylase PuuD [Roseateles asaccharophilus]MDR7334796.1 putative membrane protein [Roseateles asaccharophilus]